MGKTIWRHNFIIAIVFAAVGAYLISSLWGVAPFEIFENSTNDTIEEKDPLAFGMNATIPIPTNITIISSERSQGLDITDTGNLDLESI